MRTRWQRCVHRRDRRAPGTCTDTPAIGNAVLVMGNGIIAPGGIGNIITKNLVFDHDKTGISFIPFPGCGANDDLPNEDEWTVTCAERREQPPADEIPESPSVDDQIADLPDPPDLDDMPDAETAPAVPAADIVVAVDIDAIEVPAAPAA